MMRLKKDGRTTFINYNELRGVELDYIYLARDLCIVVESRIGHKECINKNENRKVGRTWWYTIEDRKCVREREIIWLTKLWNNILKPKRMPGKCQYKHKGDIQDCTNFHSIKLMNHTIMGDNNWTKLRHETDVSRIQLVYARTTNNKSYIYSLRRLIERFNEKKKRKKNLWLN